MELELLKTIESIVNELQEIKKAVTKETIKEEKSDWITIEQAAQLLNYTKKTVYKKIACKEIPHYQTGNNILFSERELNDWIKKHRVATVEERQNAYLNR